MPQAEAHCLPEMVWILTPEHKWVRLQSHHFPQGLQVREGPLAPSENSLFMR